ncbi:hypothetical protein VB319_25575 [Vibrio parahaemolyticus]|uniref:hypothetical protein n=1 Tax=Vibrio parahaemolyticus TaxID=670 RepID=UPI0028C10207|nr:hypothetical protein [Vibrio parahaemolyticus]HDY7671215.1 hypothetical protein [Vibrio vulnificus]EGR2854664.1 hypothetical protein [Vibrio parahaemolyticus]EGR2987020.1 hypothetical protein [Vibrio parahaemolyticus]MBE4204989.1 hypothetical protein [Vibrio parahaemolyticus]MEA5357302.1 hypothetical protein [Vibrio parahaemolyticus]
MTIDVVKDLQSTFTSFPEGYKKFVGEILPSYGETEWRELVAYFGSILSGLVFKPDSKNNDFMDELLPIAIKCEYQSNHDDPQALKHFRSEYINELFFKNNGHLLTRQVFESVKDYLFEPTNYYSKARRYVPYFADVMNTSDIMEYLRIKPESPESKLSEMIDSGMVDRVFIKALLESRCFQHLPDDIRNANAEAGLMLNAHNLKHLNEENRSKYLHLVCFDSNPLLTKHHPNTLDIEKSKWIDFVNKDPRCLRFVPRVHLLCKSLFPDDYLFELLKKNQCYFYARYRLVSFINEIAPERLTYEFCKKIKESGFHEQHHLVVCQVLKNKG